MGRTIGTCSICSGAVTVPDLWWGVTPPIPTCSSCGAVPVAPFGPVIPMRPAPRFPIEYVPMQPKRSFTVDYVRRQSTTVQLPDEIEPGYGRWFRLGGGGRWTNGGYVCS